MLKELLDTNPAPTFARMQEQFESIGVDVDETKWGIIPQDDINRPIDKSILPETMIQAGQSYLINHHRLPPDTAREAAIELFREMSAVAPTFDHVDQLYRIKANQTK